MTELAIQEQIVRLEARLARIKNERHPLLSVHSDDPYDRLSTLWLLARYEAVDDQRPLGPEQHDMVVAALDELLTSQRPAASPAAAATAILLADDPGTRLNETRRGEIIKTLFPTLSDWVEKHDNEAGILSIGLIDSLRLPQGAMMIRALATAGRRLDVADARAAAERLLQACIPLVDAAEGHAQAFRWLVRDMRES